MAKVVRCVALGGSSSAVAPDEVVYRPSRAENNETTKITWTEVQQYDENGELVKEFAYSPKFSKNRGGFVLAYTQAMSEFLERTSSGSTVRVFLYIAQHQDYGTNGVFGFRTTRGYLAKALGLTRKSVYSALEFLKERFLVNELRIDGSLEFMVNPDYITMGADRKARDREWNERWKFYNQYIEVKTTANRRFTPNRDSAEG